MKRLFFGALIAFGIGALSFCAISLLTNLSRNYEIPWLSENGMTAMWPLTVGLSSVWLMALSVVLLVLVSVVGLIQDFFVKRRTRLNS